MEKKTETQIPLITTENGLKITFPAWLDPESEGFCRTTNYLHTLFANLTYCPIPPSRIQVRKYKKQFVIIVVLALYCHIYVNMTKIS